MSHYDALGVRRDASLEEITSAYRRLALQFHPDRVPVEERAAAAIRFQQISNAYEILRDEELRRDYDRGLEPEARTAPADLFTQEFGELISIILADLCRQAPDGERIIPTVGWGTAGAVAGYVVGAIVFAPAAIPAAGVLGVAGAVRGYTGSDMVTTYQNMSPETKQRVLEMLRTQVAAATRQHT